MSPFFGLDRDEVGCLLDVLVEEELMRELSCEVKERVVEEEMALSPASLRWRWMP